MVVVEENKSFGEILGPHDPSVDPTYTPGFPGQFLNQDVFIQSLAQHGASFTNSRSLTHPSQPNYLDLFSGSDQGVTSDAVPSGQFNAPNLGGELLAAGLTFKGYSESLPRTGSLTPKHKHYTRSHNPWSDFADVPAGDNVPFNRFPRNFDNLPTVSFVVPNLLHDMHSASIRDADRWLEKHMKRYARWAENHNSLLIVTWDEGNSTLNIPTIFYGGPVRAGQYAEPITHFNVLRTIEDMYGLAPTGAAATATPITDVWR